MMTMSSNFPPNPAEHLPSEDPNELEQMARLHEALITSNVQGRRSVATDKVRTAMTFEEKLERVRHLKFCELVIEDHEHPEESQAIKGINRLYDLNLIPDDVLLKFEQDVGGSSSQFITASKRGGMLNRFHVNETERSLYRQQPYKSVKEQLIDDMLGRSGKPGDYRVFGLCDQGNEEQLENHLRAYVSVRMPPKDPKERGPYMEYLKKILLDPKKLLTLEMMYMRSWDKQRMQEKLGDWTEIDTINVERGYPRASIKLLYEVVMQMIREYGDLPGPFYCYRFNGLSKPDESNQRVTLGQNNASYNLFERELHFHLFAFLSDMNEVVVRQMPDEQIDLLLQPEWSYLYSGPSNLKRRVKYLVEDRNLVPETSDTTEVISGQ